jgi:hypothetical protein
MVMRHVHLLTDHRGSDQVSPSTCGRWPLAILAASLPIERHRQALRFPLLVLASWDTDYGRYVDPAAAAAAAAAPAAEGADGAADTDEAAAADTTADATLDATVDTTADATADAGEASALRNPLRTRKTARVCYG